MKNFRSGIFRIVLSAIGICLLLVFAFNYSEQETVAGPQGETGTLEKLAVANGDVTMNLDLGRLNGARTRTARSNVGFKTEENSFFTSMAFNGEFRGFLPSSMKIASDASALPASMAAAGDRLIFESLPFGGDYELAIRDSKSGFTFFYIEGYEYDFDAEARSLKLTGGRLILTSEYANELGRASDAGSVIGDIEVNVNMRVLERAQVINDETVSTVLPADPLAGTNPGPDVVVGDLIGLAQFGGASGNMVGLAVGTDSCNYGTVDLNWFQMPNNDHPVIPQNMYRMSGGPNNDERFEQIGQSSVKHAFTALTQNLCNLGCNGVGGSRLGSGCSDPYSASLNSGPNLGSRAWINPFTGFYPRGDSATPSNSHSGHSHNGTTHRILTPIEDLATNQNPGATYYAEAQYVTPHEYQWCQSNPTQCNMYNNVSYRRYNVTGNGSPFSFSPAASTVREKAAISAWPGSTSVEIHPAPGADGTGILAYKVTNPSAGVWRYEYAIYNSTLDRGIGSFSLPIGNGVTLSNIDFHAPPQHPGSAADGTVGGAGFSSTEWTATQAGGALTWATETFAVNQNANAIRWGTMYNFRFESNQPPTTANATIGFFKTGSPITVAVQVPSGAVAANATVSGRVTAGGRAVSQAVVTISNGSGTVGTYRTGSFGYFTFPDLPTGVTYTVSVAAKRYTFTAQQVSLTNNIFDLNLAANNP